MIIDVSSFRRSTLFGKLIRLPLRLIPPSSVVRVVQGPNRGRRWIAGSGPAGFWVGCYEKEKQLRFFQQLKPGDVIFDIGANAGFYTLLSSKAVGSLGRVIAFEPLPHNVKLLRQHIAINSVANAAIFELAVTNATGHATFLTSNGPLQGRVDDRGDIVVETNSIDAMFESNLIPPPNVIKMDIEGGEILALQGAMSTLRRFRPILYLAVHNNLHQECVRLLRDAYDTLEWFDRDELIARFSGQPKVSNKRGDGFTLENGDLS